MYCENGVLQNHHWTQDQCQDLCQQSQGCVGISYSPLKKSCYVCNDYILFPTAGDLNGYGFYRNPGIMGNHVFGLGNFFIYLCFLWPLWLGHTIVLGTNTTTTRVIPKTPTTLSPTSITTAAGTCTHYWKTK